MGWSGGRLARVSSERTGGLLVARDEEVARLVELIDNAVAGTSGALFVLGEVGVGKTALVREACAQRRELVDVCWATCLPLSSLLVPFLPLRSALREWAGKHSDDDVPPPLSRSDAASDADMPVLFDDWLQQAGLRRPVVLVVDDLQWADRSTRTLLMCWTATGQPGSRTCTNWL